MGEITVYFVGICTFMQDFAEHVAGVRRRVVLVNARLPQVINGTKIPPHIPTLRIAASDLEVNGVPATTENGCILEWELHGCKIEIADAIGDLQHDESFECCIPHLKALTPDADGVSTSVVLEGESNEASCYFDLTAGRLSAGLVANGAAVSVLKAQTATDSPILRLQRFRTDEIQEFRLRPGTQIALMNVGLEGLTGDDTTDFLLHYKVVRDVPPNAAIPTAAAPCCRPLPASYIVPSGRLGLGPGCSNSSFP
ncbi:MAG: hypothetical protein QOH21_3044 [Acidobacteriota bacterium]|jgi:hypothetical protein|nr:hypothetical protein [Acidobacteriota bacterium]